MVGVLIAALLASATPATGAAPVPLPQAQPALWVLRDDDTTVYLFGTFHALDGRHRWFNNEVRAAFSNSDELVLETIVPERPRISRQASPHRPVQGGDIASGTPFLTATRTAVAAGGEHGMQVSKGADMVLRRAAESEGKPIAGLETFDFQLSMFSRMAPVSSGTAAPTNIATAKTQLALVMTSLQAAWNRGDQRVFAALLAEMRRTSPDSYRAMFPERNADWANWIVNRMEQPGIVFVAVGAGHFAGPDSVQSKLTLKGMVATRIN